MPHHHLELVFELGALDPEAAETACFDAGAVAVTLSSAPGAGELPVLEPQPGEVRLWPRTRVQALFQDAEPERESALRAAVAARLGLEPERLALRAVPERVWEREWLRDFHALRFGERLWVCPQHESVEQSDAVIVRLDPGLAFGTGTHASTALCLEWLDAAARAPPSSARPCGAGGVAWRGAPGGAIDVIDYGCGSGILAIAALKLGARCAYAFDYDPQARLATAENAARNGVSERLRICEGVADLPARCDLLLANILAAVLIEHAEQFAARVRRGGELVLSGILAAEAGEVAAGFAKWFDMRRFALRDGWVALSGTRC
jgi:ribosomal protein L11 methyltransferase